MINHKFKCIFIHIPCAGVTSIENWICGKDYWNIDNKEKHLLSCQAKEMYAEYWDEYFKFSIVRNPYRRTVSMLKDPSFFGVTIDEGNLDFTKYLNNFGFPITVEYDHRFYNKNDIQIKNPQPNCVYKNFLSEKIDCIYKYEQGHRFIQKDLSDRLSIPINRMKHLQKNKIYPTINNFVETNSIYQRDFTEYNYEPRLQINVYYLYKQE